MYERTVGAVLGAVLLTACGGARSKPPTSDGNAAPVASATAILVTTPPPRDDGRLPDLATPTGYRLELDLDPQAAAFAGHVRIGIRIPKVTRAVVVHGRDLRISAAAIERAGAPSAPLTATFRAPARGKGESDELVLGASSDLAAGEATLDIRYTADFSEGLNGLYHVQAAGKSYAFTQFEPVGARLAFPCFDEPSAKVPFEVSVTAPKELAVLSNMPEHAAAPSPDGAKTTHEFEKSPPLPTYLVALAVGPLEMKEAQGAPVPLRVVSTPGGTALGAAALATAADHVRVLERYFGTKYPYPKLDLVAVPNFASGAMENAGLITFREERLLIDDATAPTSMRRALYGVIAHELSHMWFGDLVTMKWWNDIWLNEGFATWMATRVLDTWRPEMHAGVEAFGSTAVALHADTLDSARAVRQPVRSTTEALEAFDGITYVKGAALLGMVEKWLGEETFQKGVVQYLAEHRFANAAGEDLFQALEAASGKDVPSVLASFTEQTGVPLVTFDACRMEAGRPMIPVRQKEYRPLGATATESVKLWKFPVCVRFGEGKDRPGDGQACVFVDGEAASLSLGTEQCPLYFHPNADQAGYYRASIPTDDLTELGALDPGSLTARERVGLLADSWALVESGGMSVVSYFELARSFRGAPEAEVWDQIVSALDTVGTDVVAEEDTAAFAREVREILGKEAAQLGFASRPKDPDEVKTRRRTVLSTLGTFGRDPTVLAKAKAVTARWLAQKTKVDGDDAALALPLTARSGDAKLFDAIVARLTDQALPVDRVLASIAVGSFTDPELVKRALELVLDGKIRSQDQAYVFRGLFGRRETRGLAFRIVEAQLDAFLAKIPPFARRRLVPMIARSCSTEGVEHARALFTPRLPTLEGADRGFAQALEEGTRCAAFREQQEAHVSAWVNGKKGSAPVR